MISSARGYFSVLLVLFGTTCFVQAGWMAGVAKTRITPRQSMWMSGYAARTRPAEGTLNDLWAKALVLEEQESGEKVAVVTLDLVGIDRTLGLAIRNRIASEFGIPLRSTAVMTSHTHSGPVVGTNLRSMYVLDDAQQRLIQEYTGRLEDDVVALLGRALRDLESVALWHGMGRATFAVNRRNNRESEVAQMRRQGRLDGPVDHEVPVLAVKTGHSLKAVVFGYASHATVLDGYQWSGDYPGFAQSEIEKVHPSAMAFFWAGCGADQNPLPRRRVEYAREYGRRLARAVGRVVEGEMQMLHPGISTRYAEIPLAFHEIPTRAMLVAWSQSANTYQAGRGRKLLALLDSQGTLDVPYSYPVQTWRLGSDLMWVILGGEVVVDFSLRIKKEIVAPTVWVAGYANDVMAYIPSLRVLREGGYEGEGAMLYYGLPSKWAEGVEEAVVDEVVRQWHEQTQAAGRR